EMRRRDVDRPAPRVRDAPSAELGEEANEALASAPDHARVELELRGAPCAEPHGAPAPAEGDAVVCGRAHVVHELPRIDDRLPASPAELVEHVRNGLGEDDVARGDGERQPVAAEADG